MIDATSVLYDYGYISKSCYYIYISSVILTGFICKLFILLKLSYLYSIKI